MTKAVMPAWRSTVGSVRASSMPMSAHWASVHQIFWPVTSQPVAVGLGPGAQRRQVAAGVGLAEQLAPDVLAGRGCGGAASAFCSSRAEGEERVAGQHHLVERAVGVAEDQLLHDDQVVHRVVVGPTAPLDRPAAAEVAGVVERRPATPGSACSSAASTGTRSPSPRIGCAVLGDEGPDLGPEPRRLDSACDRSTWRPIRTPRRAPACRAAAGVGGEAGVVVDATFEEVEAVLPGEPDGPGELEQVVEDVRGRRRSRSPRRGATRRWASGAVGRERPEPPPATSSDMPRTRTAWSASRCCTAWNPPMARPKACRSLA